MSAQAKYWLDPVRILVVCSVAIQASIFAQVAWAAEKSNTTFATSMIAFGWDRLAEGDAEQARFAFETALALAVDAAAGDLIGRAHLGLGRTQMRSGNLSEASFHLDQAVRQLPDEPAVYLALAQVYRAERKPVAEEQAARALLARGFPLGHWLLGRALAGQGRHEEALQSFESYLTEAKKPSDEQRQAIADYRRRAKKAKSLSAEARDLADWATGPSLRTAHLQAYNAFYALARLWASTPGAPWQYWDQHYHSLGQQSYPLIGQARAELEKMAPRTEIVQALHARYLAFLNDLDAAYRMFFAGVRFRDVQQFDYSRSRIPILDRALKDLIEDVDDASEDLAD